MRIIIIRRRWAAAAFCLCTSAAILWLVANPSSISTTAQQRSLPIYSVEVQGEEQLISLTFDAAWGDEDTQAIVDVLNSQEVPATIFAVGEWAQRCPEAVKALQKAGHEVMNHSATHPHLSQCSREEVTQQVLRGNEMISALTGQTPTLFRCPYGEYNDEIIRTVRSLGMMPVQWDVDALERVGVSRQCTVVTPAKKRQSRGSLFFR